MTGIVNSTGARSGVIGTTVGTPVSTAVWTEIGSAGGTDFGATSSLELGQTLGTGYKRHKLFLTIGNAAGTAVSTHYYMQFEVSGSWLNGTEYCGSIWWSNCSASGTAGVGSDANNDTSSFKFNSSEGTPFLNGSSATNISAFAGYEFTFSNFTQSGTDNWSHLWYSGIACNHDAGNPGFTTKGACQIMDTGAITDIKIWPTSDRTIKGNWQLYGIS